MNDDDLRWVDAHAAQLRELSERVGADEEVARAVAAMVVHGFGDARILAELSGHIPVWDGQHNPLDPVQALLPELRRAVAES
jgi:hypothetical protein